MTTQQSQQLGIIRHDIHIHVPSVNSLGSSDAIWVNIGPGNGLLPDGTKPLPEPMLTYHLYGPVTIT